jgi:hypothetical protein
LGVIDIVDINEIRGEGIFNHTVEMYSGERRMYESMA